MRTVVVKPFNMSKVRLTDGPVKKLMEANRRYLDSISIDCILHNFRVNAGIPCTADAPGGWSGSTSLIRGHLEGHYLSAISLLFGSTGDIALKDRADMIVNGLSECQANLGGKYLSAFPESLFDDLDAGKPVLVPWYVIHKIMAGLYDAYIYCDNTQARDILENLADWVRMRLDRLSDEQLALMLKTEYGGMNEVLYNIFFMSSRIEDLECAHRFQENWLYDPLANGTDNLRGLHGNTAMAKILGAARRYELEGDIYYRNVAANAWEYIANCRSYATGGSTCGESWGDPGRLADSLSSHNEETCVSYNLLKLTRYLFSWTGDVKYADYYERTLLNAIIGTMNPADGMKMYYMPLESGYFKHFHSPNDHMWCCTGSGMESFSKLGDSIYFYDMDSIYVNLFIGSTVEWTEKGVVITQTTDIPQSDSVTFTVNTLSPAAFNIKIRVPYWAENGITVKINNILQKLNPEPSSYIILDRKWSDGDSVNITIPAGLHVNPLPDDPGTVAFMYGPFVLAGLMGDRDMHPDTGCNFMTRATRPAYEEAPELKPDLMSDTRDPSSLVNSPGLWFKPVAGEPLTFILADGNRSIKFQPLNRIFNHRYTVYWNILPIQEDNVSQGRTATASSYYQDCFPGKAFDGRTTENSVWRAEAATLPQWLQVDLGQKYDITRCETYFENPDLYYRYYIEYSLNGTDWSIFKDRRDCSEAGNPCHIDNNIATGRYIRITVTGPGCVQACIREFKVYSVPLSIRCSVRASSACKDFPAHMAVDGDIRTKWMADQGIFPQWLCVDLGRNYHVKKCRTYFDADQKGYKYLIEYSTNNIHWRIFADNSDNNGTGNPYCEDAGDVTARYMRITVTGAGDSILCACISEFKVYGEPVSLLQGKYAADLRTMPQWLQIDLGKRHHVEMCKTRFRDVTKSYKYRIEYSLDNINWELYIDKTDNVSIGNPYVDKNVVKARYMRVAVTGEEQGLECVRELEVYGVPVTPVSRGKAATASSIYVVGGKMYSPDLACDGRITEDSRWIAGSTDMPQWLQLDLGDYYDITNCEIYYEFAERWYKYRIEYSKDGTIWEVFEDKTGDALPAGRILCYNVNGSITARYIRIVTTESQDDVRVSIWEFSVYGTARSITKERTAASSSACSISDEKNSLDGDISYQCRCKAGGADLPQGLEVDMGSEFDILYCETYFEYTGRWYRYIVEYSTDTANWIMYADKRDNTLPANPYYTDTNSTTFNIVARYIRITVTESEYGQACIRDFKISARRTPLSRNGPATASSESNTFYMGDRFAKRAFDGDMSTSWLAADGSFPQWLQVDLGRLCNIRKCETYFEKNNHWYKYKIEYSADALNWEIFSDRIENMKLMGRYYLDTNDVAARYMRVTVTAAQEGCACIYEFKVYD